MTEPESLAADEEWQAHRRRHEYDRLLMVSDGVFAIAVTLAALEIRIPEGLVSLAAVLDRVGPQLGAYLVSFLVIAVFWVGHRDLFACLRRVDPWLNALTLALLCGVALIPASTHSLYANQAASGSFRFYALTMTLCGAISTGMWLYPGLKPELLVDGVPHRYRLVRAASTAIVPLMFLLILLCPPGLAVKIILPIAAAMILLRRLVLPRIMRG